MTIMFDTCRLVGEGTIRARDLNCGRTAFPMDGGRFAVPVRTAEDRLIYVTRDRTWADGLALRCVFQNGCLEVVYDVTGLDAALETPAGRIPLYDGPVRG